MTEPEPFDLQSRLLPKKSIQAHIRKRLAPDIFETISPKLQEEYEANGWVLAAKLKRTVKMRKLKPHDVAFEDRVWATMAKLNFADLNQDRHFRLPYGEGQNETKQVDVFAADDEVVLVIEAKSCDRVTTSAFKKDVEAITGTREGIIRTIKKSGYPNHKIRFILATNNFGLTQETLERVKAADILHMSEDTIDYYLNLAEHLGKAARYQLLGALFADQKIPGLDPKVPAIQGKMGGHTYYSFAIEPARLLKLGYVLHRNKANSELMPTYQRLIKRSRLQKVTQFVDADGFFPNSIIVNIATKRQRLRFERVSQQEGSAKLGILHLPQTYRAAYIIDGQHRLYGYAGSDRAETDLIPVVAFENMPRADQVRLFMQINENQQAVPKNLRNTLNADLLWDSEDLRERVRALKLKVAQDLGESRTSPLFGRVIVGENPRSLTRCITIDAISTGLERSNFIGSFTKTEVRSPGTFYRGSNDAIADALIPYLQLCFAYMRDSLPTQWTLGNGEGGFLFINNGVESLVRIFSDIVDHLVEKEGITPNDETAQDMFSMTSLFLEPLVTFLANLDSDEAISFRRQYGTAGRARYWRRLQTAIHEPLPDFSPPGLQEYLEEQEKAFNTQSFAMIRELETFLNKDIRRRLEDEYHANWFKKGVPLKIQKEAAQLAIDKNQDREAENELEPWACLHLIDYQAIMTKDAAVWQKLFQKRYTRPGEETKSGGAKGRTSWLVELNRIRNQNDHEYVVSEEEYEFLVGLTSWLIEGHSENTL